MKPSEIGVAGKLAVLKLRLEILKASGSSGKGHWNRWPAGSSKGGEFAPKGSGYGGSGSSYAGMGVPKWLGGTGKPASMTFDEVGGPGWGHYAKPKAPPPGAKPHPKTDDKGKAVSIDYPSKPSHSSAWGDSKKSAVFVPGGEAPKSLHGVPMKPWTPPEKGWASVTGTNPKIDADFPFQPNPAKSTGAGVLIVEKDGRVWLTKPTNAFGGYQNTYPKGTAETGLTMQQNAIKEAWEETGLKVKITGVLGDYERDTSRARYYIAVRETGTPRDMGWESQAMTLATTKDARTLLNKQHDKDILDDLEDLFSISKKNPGKGGHWQNQPRWPGGSALGGQWKTMGADGITLPPVIAGGLESKNPSYQKKVVALHAAAQKGDKSAVKEIADGLTPYAEKFAAGQKTSSHTKWFAGVHQYAIQVLHDLDAGVKAQATSDRVKGPETLSQAFVGKVAEKSKGSNPGAIYQDASGANWLVKGNLQLKHKAVTQAVSDDRARNEVLASKLMIAAGVGAPEMKLVDLEGKHEGGLGVASKWMPGTALNPSNKAHIDAMRSDYVVHAWLANYDVVGLEYDNTIISADGKAHCIDPGGALLFRAQGTPKGPSHGVIGGALDAKAPELESMRSTNSEQKAIFGGMTQSDLHASAAKLNSISDDTIRTLVKTYGPGDEAAREKLAQSLIDRKNSILERTGHAFQMQAGAVIASSAAPEVPPVAAPVSPASIGGRWTGSTKLIAIQEEATAAGVHSAAISMMSGVLQNPGHYSLQTAKNFANAYATDPDLMGQKEAPYMVAFWRQLVLIKQVQGEGLPPSPTTAQTVGAGLTGTAKLEALAQAAKDAGSAAVSDPAAFAVNSVKSNSVAEIKSLITYYADEAKLGVAGSKEMVAAWQEALAQKDGAAAPSTQLPPPATGAGLTGQAKLEALAQAAKDAGANIGSPKDTAINLLEVFDLQMAEETAASWAVSTSPYAPQVYAMWAEAARQHLAAATKQAQPATSPIGALGAALSNEAKLQSLAHAAVIAGVNETPDHLINLAGANWVTAKQADALAKDATKHHPGPKGEALAAFWNEVSQQKAGADAKPAAPGATTPVLGPEKLKGLAAAAGNSLSAKAAGLSASEMMSHIQSMTLTEAMQMKQTLSNSPNLPQSGPVVAFYNALLRSKMATVEAAGDAIAAKVSPGLPPVPAFSTGYETSDNYYKKLSQKALDAHAAGDIAALNAMTVKKNGKPAWPTTTVNGKKMQEFHEAVLADATAKKAGGIVAGMQDADAGLSKPAVSPPPFAPKVAMPNAKALLLPESNKNAKSHNAKVGLVEKLGQEGDVKGLLSLGFGTNTYSKQQVKLTNDVLAALGSPLKVSTGQKPNAHPALFGNVSPDIAAAAAATVGVPMPPKSTVGNVLQAAMQDAVNSSKDWKPTLLPGEKIVEQGESFGVKWAKIETPAKGFMASEIPAPPDFFSNGSQGPTGTWKSTVEALNKANNDAVKSIYDAAISSGGNVEAFKTLKFDVIDKGTGLPNGQKVDISKHPAAAVKEYFDQIGSELAAQQKVGYKSVQSGSFTGAYSAAAEHLATTHKKVAYDQFKNAQRAADYVVLSKDGASAIPLPQGNVFKEWAPTTGARVKFKEASKESFFGLTGSEKQAARAYTGSAYDSWNEALRTGATTSGSFQAAQTMVNAFKKAVLDVPEGTILWRGVGVGQSTFESVVGGVIQDGSFNSASYGDRPGGPGESKGTWLRIHIPKTGVKALDATVFSGFGSQEREIIIQNGVRYAILKVQHHPKWTTSAGNIYYNKTIVDVIALPHEP